MRENVYAALRAALECDSLAISGADRFRQYDGWDSLAALSLVAELDDRFGVSIDSETFATLSTVDDLVNEVLRRGAAAPVR
jgi:acyl carrier protein